VNLSELLFGSPAVPTDVADLTDPVVYAGESTWTRAELQARADALAATLTGLGIGPGRSVGVMLPNTADPVAALFGTWRAGGIYVPLNPRLTATELAAILEGVTPAVVVTTADHVDRFGGYPVVVAEPDGWSVVPGSGSGTASVASDQVHDLDVALIQFTSGTTGTPKPVLLRHSGVLKLLDGVLAKLRSGSNSKSEKSGSTKSGSSDKTNSSPMPNLIPVSLSLWAGLYNVLFALRVDAPVVIMDGFEPHEFAALVRRFAIRSTVLPPAAMTMLADDESITDLAPLRFVRSITAPLSPLQARRFKDRFGIAVLNSYGQTEIGGEIVGWNAADSRAFGETKLGSVGRPHDGVEVRVVDGELWVLTPALSAGYADGTDLSDRLSPDGWFRTGDFGRVDDEGFVWIEGRVSSMINRGGLKIAPGEVEEVIRLHPAVADVAVAGVADERLGEVPWAFVVQRGMNSAVEDLVDEAELEDLCRQHLAPYKVPVRFVSIAALPRNEVGKVLLRDLISLAATAGEGGGQP